MSAPLAYRIAVSVIPSLGARRGTPAAVDPFAEPAASPAAALADKKSSPTQGGLA